MKRNYVFFCFVLVVFSLFGCNQSSTNNNTETVISSIAGKRFLISNEKQDQISFYNYFCSDSQISSIDVSDSQAYFISRFRNNYVSFGDNYELRRPFAMGVYFVKDTTHSTGYTVLVSGYYKENTAESQLVLYITNIYKDGSVYFDSGAISQVLGEGNEKIITIPLELSINKAILTINSIKYYFEVYNDKYVYTTDDKTSNLSPTWFTQNE